MRVIFFTECSNTIGLGHFKRCLTLAKEFLADNYSTIEFIISEEIHEAKKIAELNGIPCTYLSENIETLFLNLNASTIFIVDVKTDYFDSLIVRIRHLGCEIFGIDDLTHRNKFYTANFSPPAAVPISKTEQQSNNNFIGWEWVPVFNDYRDHNHRINESTSKDIFLFFGGSDADNLGIPSCKFFCSVFHDFKIHLICGTLMDKTSLAEVQKLEKLFQNLILYIAPAEIQQYFKKNAFYITSFGHTYYEMLASGINPILIYRTTKDIAGIENTFGQLGNPHLTVKDYLALLNANSTSRKIWDLKFKNQISNIDSIKYLSNMLLLGSKNIANKINNMTKKS